MYNYIMLLSTCIISCNVTSEDYVTFIELKQLYAQQNCIIN